MSGVRSTSRPASDPAASLADGPPPAGSPAGQAFSRKLAAGRLMMQVCADCGCVQYPARELCRSCLSTNLNWRQQDGLGTLIAATIVRRPYDPYFQSQPPARIGLVRLDTDVTVIVFLEDDCPAPSSRVRLVARSDPAGHGKLVAEPLGGVQSVSPGPR